MAEIHLYWNKHIFPVSLSFFIDDRSLGSTILWRFAPSKWDQLFSEVFLYKSDAHVSLQVHYPGNLSNTTHRHVILNIWETKASKHLKNPSTHTHIHKGLFKVAIRRLTTGKLGGRSKEMTTLKYWKEIYQCVISYPRKIIFNHWNEIIFRET